MPVPTFPTFKSMETISCHSRLGQKTWHFVLPAYRCYMWNLARIGFMASVKMSFENVDDDGRTADACLYYKFTYEPLTQLRWTNKKQTSQICFLVIHHLSIFPFKSIKDESWPLYQKVKGHSRVIIWLNLVVRTAYAYLYYKLKNKPSAQVSK